MREQLFYPAVFHIVNSLAPVLSLARGTCACVTFSTVGGSHWPFQ